MKSNSNLRGKSQHKQTRDGRNNLTHSNNRQKNGYIGQIKLQI